VTLPEPGESRFGDAEWTESFVFLRAGVLLLGPPRGLSYLCGMSDVAKHADPKLWQPHPDDAADVAEAMTCADRGEVLSPEATDAFLRWMAGGSDESWRDELA
jgi:hypothetical protein